MREPLFYLSMILFVSIVGMMLVKGSPFYRRQFLDEKINRFAALDGLRGVLSISVFIHHCQYFAGYFRTGKWDMDKQSFSFMIGNVGVSVFFMITGFLFWNKVVEANGRIKIFDLYKSRFFRIYPMFFVSFLAILLITFFRSGWTLHESPIVVATEISNWLIVGLFGFPAINDLHPWYINNAGVNWSLQWEVWFYLMLPMIGLLLWKPAKFFCATLLFFLLIPLTKDYFNIGNIFCFIAGASATYIIKWRPVPPFTTAAMSTICIVLLVALSVSASYFPSFVWKLIAFPIFLLVLWGCDLFGMLTSKSWRMLGLASYSIYLIHGTVLYLTLSLVNSTFPIGVLSDAKIFVVLLGCSIAVVVTSALTYRYVEWPFISKKKRPGRDQKYDAGLRLPSLL